MNSNPKISIVIPVYNGADYLQESIESALAQSYQNIEVIVVNDGSIDETDDIAKTYGDKIRYFKKENGGVSSALNVALREMSGEYFSWLSHDDVYYPDKIKIQIDFLLQCHEDNIILYSDYDFIDEKSHVTQTVVLDHHLLCIKKEYALLRSAINGCTLLIPKKAFDEHGLFNEKLKCTQDYAKWFEMMQKYSFVHIPEVLVKYRLHELQGTKKNPLVEKEGNSLWIDMMQGISPERRIKLEGNEYHFFAEMKKYLRNTPYKKAMQFARDKMQEIICKDQKNKIIVSVVLHSSNKYGAERAALDMIDILLKNNIFVHVVLPSEGLIEGDLVERNIPYDIVSLRWWANVQVGAEKFIDYDITVDAIQLAKVITRIRPNIIYTNTSVISQGAIAAKILGIPHVWNIAEFGRKEHGIEYLIGERERMKFMDEYSDYLFFSSEAIKKHYIKKNDIEHKSFVIPPITVKNLKEKEKKTQKKYFRDNVLKIAIVGYVTEGKGQKDAILAIKELKNDAVELVIAGGLNDEVYVDNLKKIVQEFGIEHKVSFVGYSDDILNLIKQSDVILMCSIFEGFGRVTVEALFNKKPVIGANSGATPELIDNEQNGLLYEPGNYKELAKKIEYFMNNREKINIFGENGARKVMKQFNENVIEGLLLGAFYALLENEKKNNVDFLLDKSVKCIEMSQEKMQEMKKEIDDKNYELQIVKSSGYWRIRDRFLYYKNGFLFLFLSPKDFLNKYFGKR